MIEYKFLLQAQNAQSIKTVMINLSSEKPIKKLVQMLVFYTAKTTIDTYIAFGIKVPPSTYPIEGTEQKLGQHKASAIDLYL